jgi:hypothetical protein
LYCVVLLRREIEASIYGYNGHTHQPLQKPFNTEEFSTSILSCCSLEKGIDIELTKTGPCGESLSS